MVDWFLLGIGASLIGSLFSSSESDNRYEREKRERERMQRHIDDLEDENDDLYYENSRLREQNRRYRLTIKNHKKLLRNYDEVNNYAKDIGFKGAVDFFYYLANEHDNRFFPYAKFLNQVRHMRNDVAHKGKFFDIEDDFLYALEACLELCNRFDRLPNNRRFYLPKGF